MQINGSEGMSAYAELMSSVAPSRGQDPQARLRGLANDIEAPKKASMIDEHASKIGKDSASMTLQKDGTMTLKSVTGALIDVSA